MEIAISQFGDFPSPRNSFLDLLIAVAITATVFSLTS